MYKDELGNELQVGDLIEFVQRDDQMGTAVRLTGRVAKIESGGIVTPGGQRLAKHPEQIQVTPGMLYVSVMFANSFDPRSPNIAVRRLQDPEPETARKIREESSGLRLN